MGMLPLFNSAPRIRIAKTITVGGKTETRGVALAMGLDVSVSIDITPVYVCGDIAPISLEPSMYNVVTGTMQIMRFISGFRRSNQISNAEAIINTVYPPKTATVATPSTDMGGATVTTATYTPTPSISEPDTAEQIKMFMHLDPRVVLLSETFDIDLQISVPTSDAVSRRIIDANTKTAIDSTKGVSNITVGYQIPQFEWIPWLSIKNCRLTSANTNISLGQLLNEPVSFQGLLVTPVQANGDSMFKNDTGMDQKD